jgi:hypothetical protein
VRVRSNNARFKAGVVVGGLLGAGGTLYAIHRIRKAA